VSNFNDTEIDFLQSQRLARLATVDQDAQPDVAPVGFEFDGNDFYVGGFDMEHSRKYQNVSGGNDLVALVVDDVVSTDPFIPRFVRVYGRATTVRRDGHIGQGLYLRIEPTMSWSWNLDGRARPQPKEFTPHRVTHRAA
jgi:pyridoxamine 5'-phosphate oxidase family protein